MALAGRALLAFDAGSVSCATFAWGLRGSRVLGVNRAPLAPGALAPSPLEANIVRAPEVAAALASLRPALGANPKVTLVLPGGIARISLLSVPAGAEPAEFTRFRLGPGLPYPASEAIVDALKVGRGLALGAAIRRRVVESYEAAATAAGFEAERVDLAPLAAVSALLRHGPPSAHSVDVILGDAAVSLAAYAAGGRLGCFRTRLRDPGSDEAERIRQEIERTAADAGASPRHVRVLGSGAAELIRNLSFAGCAAGPGWDPPQEGLTVDAVEMSWLGAALA